LATFELRLPFEDDEPEEVRLKPDATYKEVRLKPDATSAGVRLHARASVR
jgi:hypothetical protein